uniref:ABC transporter permease n=1 Tax=Devosia sp. TaxID=1871048 RepID=UPI0035AF09A0
MALADTAQVPRRPLPRAGWWLAWLVAGVAFVALWWFGSGWAVDYPKAAQIPAMRYVGDLMKWLVNEAGFGLFSFVDLTRFIAALIELPYWFASSLIATGFMTSSGSAGVQIVPPISWIALIGGLGLVGLWAGGWRLAALVVALMAFIALFGQWGAAMTTLASILIAVPLGVVLGLFLGVLSYRLPLFEKAITPLLDLMQTVPVFAYLVPVLFLFGFGPTAAIVATIIYAMPPMTRLTVHALRSVPAEIDELGRMVGATPRQRMWKVMLPAAMPGLMVGANQVIMLSLNIVIIASMIGAGGLGFEVLGALRRLDFGVGLEAGFAIVALAIVLDRLSQAVASRLQSQPHRGEDRRPLVARHPYVLGAIVLVVGSGLLGLVEAGFQTFPEAGRLSTGSFWAEVIEWINVNFFTQLEAFKDFLLLNLLIPFKRLLLSLPWL